MAPYFFDRLPRYRWSKHSHKRISRLAVGVSTDWRKASLASERGKLKDRLLARQFHRCAYCRSDLVDEVGRVEFDHVIPKELAPQFCYHAMNLVLCCKRCNSNKGAKNITALAHKVLRKRKRYIHNPGQYIWVHPYLHVYKDHIAISGGSIFSARNGSSSGLAVIKTCRLDKMSEVLARRRRAQLISSGRAMEAVLRIAGENPSVAADMLADELLSRNDVKLKKDEIIELVQKLRSAEPISLLSALRNMG